MSDYPTSIGTSDADSITLLGQDLATDLLGQIGFAELAFWLVALRRPTPGQLRLFEAVLVALADHGLTPSALAARLTLTGAPESIQGAVAAGLLGGGSRFLGVTEDSARFLATALAGAADQPEGAPTDEAGYDALARQAVAEQRAARLFVPGLGHPVHKVEDPRTPVIYRLAAEEDVLGPHLLLLAAIGRVHPEILGRTMPLNGAGVCGAVLADLGFDADLIRGFALLARTAGLLGHIAEEQRRPIGLDLYSDVHDGTRYEPPAT